MNPKFVKHVLLKLHEGVMGRRTYGYLEKLERLQWLSNGELKELQFRKLRDLLIHAQQNTPFYKERFGEVGFDPRQMQDMKDFKVVPTLTKGEIRKNLEGMKWKGCPGGLTRYNTGGSSGEPLIFYFDRRRQAYDKAARAMTHRWWGVDVGEKELYLWGSPVELTKQDRLKSLRDRLTNEKLLSAFEISPERVLDLVREFRKFRPACVFGYPSTIALFCRFAEESGLLLSDIGVRVVFVTAEVLYGQQRETISRGFGGVPVADGYGSREGGFISHQCKEGVYHVMDPNYLIEYIRDGKEAATGEEGEVVITHLDAWGMPFIRYRTGDVARKGQGVCRCGRGFSTVAEIHGRTTDFIVTPDGRWQHALSLIYIVRDIEGVDVFKIVQETVDRVRVLIKVHKDLYPKDGNERIVSGIKKRMGASVLVDVEHVTDIPRDASGKYRYVVSKVAEKGFSR